MRNQVNEFFLIESGPPKQPASTEHIKSVVNKTTLCVSAHDVSWRSSLKKTVPKRMKKYHIGWFQREGLWRSVQRGGVVWISVGLITEMRWFKSIPRYHSGILVVVVFGCKESIADWSAHLQPEHRLRFHHIPFGYGLIIRT